MEDYDYSLIECEVGDGGNISIIVKGKFINNYKHARISCKCGVHIAVDWCDWSMSPPYFTACSFKRQKYDGKDGFITINGKRYVREYTRKEWMQENYSENVDSKSIQDDESSWSD